MRFLNDIRKSKLIQSILVFLLKKNQPSYTLQSYSTNIFYEFDSKKWVKLSPFSAHFFEQGTYESAKKVKYYKFYIVSDYYVFVSLSHWTDQIPNTFTVSNRSWIRNIIIMVEIESLFILIFYKQNSISLSRIYQFLSICSKFQLESKINSNSIYSLVHTYFTYFTHSIY